MDATNLTNEATHHVTGAAFFNTDVVDELEGRSPWYAFADADTGYPVYFNQKTEERTWKKPNAPFQFMDGTMPSGLSIDPEMLGEDFMDHPFMEPSEEHAIAQATRQVFQQGAHPLCNPLCRKKLTSLPFFEKQHTNTIKISIKRNVYFPIESNSVL